MAGGLHDVYLLRAQFRTHGRVWSFGIHYQLDSVGDPENNAVDLAGNFLTGMFLVLNDFRAADTTFEGTYVSCTLKDTANPAMVSGPSTPGDHASESLPPNICVVFTLRTNDAEAKRSGRIFVGGLPRTFVVNGQLGAILGVPEATALAVALQTPIVGSQGSWTPGILRKFKGKMANPNPPPPEEVPAPLVPNVFSPVTSVTYVRILYTQRPRNSRQIGSGA